MTVAYHSKGFSFWAEGRALTHTIPDLLFSLSLGFSVNLLHCANW